MKTYILGNIRRALVAVCLMGISAASMAAVSISDFYYNRDGGFYEIRTKADLRNLATLVNTGNCCAGLTFRQVADIAFDTISANNFKAIGNAVNAFAGTFDGDGHTISGINIKKSGSGFTDSFQGLFGRNRGTVKNVTLAASRISGHCHVGGIVGQNNPGGTISNCTVTANVSVLASSTKSLYHGGIVGYNRGSVRKCTSSANMSDNGQQSHCYVGGVAGYNCYYVCECTSSSSLSGEYFVEGLVGQNDGGACTGCHYYGSGATIRRYVLRG
ncbi:MAG: hypothetical protein E7070_04160 [Bacteroidales bacterium]|nr:hypothetical protein [Bacteroidales bacterium]